MTAMLSFTLLCQRRKSLSPAVLGLSLPCLVPAHRALCAFLMTCRAHLTAAFKWLERGTDKVPSAPLLRQTSGLKLKGSALLCQALSSPLLCALSQPREGCALAFQAPCPSWSPFPHSDVMFVVGQEQQKVFAHRCVLACRCQAFRGMLSQAPVSSQDSSSSVPPQGPFILGNVQPEVFLAVIEFLYTNSVTLNSHIVSEWGWDWWGPWTWEGQEGDVGEGGTL